MPVRGAEEVAGFFGGEGFEAAGSGCAHADVAGDVAGDLLFADGVLQGGFEDGVDVGQGQRGKPLSAALPGRAALGLVAPGVDAARAALAGGAELVEPGSDVLGGEFGELFPSEAGDEVPVDAGGVAGVGVLAEVVDGDVVQPVRQVRIHTALGGEDGEAAVAGGDLLGELGQGLIAGGAVDADAAAGVAGGEDVSGGFPAAVFSLITCPVASGAAGSADFRTRWRTSARAERIAVRAFGPAAARAPISRETVGSEATGPNTPGSARSMPTSARQSPPSVTARATSSRIFPGSCTARGRRHGANAAGIA